MAVIYFATRFVMRHFYFNRLDIAVTGRENVPPAGGALVVGNHPCAVDGHLLCTLLARRFYCFARGDLYENWFSRWHFQSMGAIPVSVGGDNQAAMEEAAARLRAGELFVILPEADVYPGTELQHFHGAFMKLALQTNVPVLPVAITGTERALVDPRPNTLRGLRLRPCAVRVEFLPLMHFDNPTFAREQFGADVARVKAVIQERVTALAAG